MAEVSNAEGRPLDLPGDEQLRHVSQLGPLTVGGPTIERLGTPAELLAAALAAFQAEYPTVRKDKTATVQHDKGSYRYSYADLAEISPVVLPLLGKHGLAFTSRPMLDEQGRFVLRYALVHAGGGREGGDYPLPDPGRSGAQQIGSAITYARRYALNAVTGIAPDDGSDDDGKAAHEHQAPAAAKADPPPVPRTPASKRGPAGGEMPATKAQVGTIQVLFRQLGFGDDDRQDKLDYCQVKIGRKIESANDLTKAEASRMIEHLSAATKEDHTQRSIHADEPPPEDNYDDAEAGVGEYAS